MKKKCNRCFKEKEANKYHLEYANIPDVTLAEQLYKKVYKGKIEEEDFYKQVFPDIAQKKMQQMF